MPRQKRASIAKQAKATNLQLSPVLERAVLSHHKMFAMKIAY
jgi:hypothetical protein